MSEKKRKRCGVIRKSLAMLFLLLGISLLVIGVQGTIHLYNMGAYYATGEELSELLLEEQMADVAKVILKKYVTGSSKEATRYAMENHCDYVIKKDDEILGGSVDIDFVWSRKYRFGEYEAGRYMFEGVRDYTITLYLQKISIPDEIWWNYNLMVYSDWLRVVFPIMLAVGVILILWNLIFLLKRIGWCSQSEVVTSGRFGRIPTDLFTVLCLALVYGWIRLMQYFWRDENALAVEVIAFYGIFILGFVWLLSIIARCKAKVLWQNSFLVWLGKKTKCGLLLLGKALMKLPLIWKTACGVAVIGLLEFLFIQIMNSTYSLDGFMYILWLVLWAFEKIILIPFLFVVVLRLRTLKVAGKALAEGNLDYKVDENKFFWELKEHAESLNRISEGVNLAVQERMKSEHFKTELITNVSHDIKTPLTSIINYSDLLSKEECDNEKITEYAQTIKRQSDRLKKLIEDLVEASKASSGSLEVHMEECEVEVLLEQAVGEFAGKFAEKDMDVITKANQTPTKIMADGRLLWRVFDNLLNNICKYAQSATRVYLSVEQEKEQAVITFKNISEYPLDITEEELMERFVRGDKSRHTEGNGLGLNIAKSLVELQKGTMQLVIDGDLFKVILRFPLLEK